MASKNALIAVRVDDREENAVKVQQVLTQNGCSISVRLGLHDQGEGGVCLSGGTLILQLSCGTEGAKSVVEELKKIKGVKAQFINLD
ncbi:MAG: hypothetical protein LBS35_14175 [Synergistaceae bacterium]|nr:hypothetical protein [Synergistaceae bacterium]